MPKTKIGRPEKNRNIPKNFRFTKEEEALLRRVSAGFGSQTAAVVAALGLLDKAGNQGAADRDGGKLLLERIENHEARLAALERWRKIGC